MDFIYQSYPIKVYFGEGQLRRINEVIHELGGTRLFVVSGSRHNSMVNELALSFGKQKVFHFSKIIQHVPREVAEEAFALADSHHSNLIIAIGGGSAIGLAKAVALQNHVRILAVPTTYAGSEMTNIYGISSEGIKKVGRDKSVLPACVIYDPAMTGSMPMSLAATSSMNAMAHLIEALYAHDGNPVTYQASLLGIHFVRKGREQLVIERSLKNANESLQFGSYLAGKALCEVSMSLHHKLAHVLGGSFNLDHSQTHTALLPYVVQYQLPGFSQTTLHDLQTALDDKDPSQKLRSLSGQMSSPVSLREIGFQKADIPKAASLLTKTKFPNPVAIDQRSIEQMLTAAYEGQL